MSADDDLAATIADRLVAAGLIDPARRDDLAKKVAAGKATPDDWRLWVELRPADDGRSGAPPWAPSPTVQGTEENTDAQA